MCGSVHEGRLGSREPHPVDFGAMLTEADSGAQPRQERIWLLSPAVATLIFFASQLFIAQMRDAPKGGVHAAAAEAGRRVPVEVRIVSQIRPLEDSAKPTTRVPPSETEFFDLLERQGCVVFSASEVENIGTPERQFRPEEVGVITADKLRRARLSR